jgi:predicted nucleic acid-binding protein
MKLVDTSCWIQALRRRGDPTVRARLEELVKSGEAAWCAPIRLELWAGIGNDKERRVLRDFEGIIRDYRVTDEVWRAACDLADLGRRHGKTFPVTDLLVAACARHYGIELEHVDQHFSELAKLCLEKAAS